MVSFDATAVCTHDLRTNFQAGQLEGGLWVAQEHSSQKQSSRVRRLRPTASAITAAQFCEYYGDIFLFVTFWSRQSGVHNAYWHHDIVVWTCGRHATATSTCYNIHLKKDTYDTSDV